jgi:hypothetical protein
MLRLRIHAGCGAGTTPASDATVPSDALSQMEIAFIGNPRQAVIKQKVEDVLALYDLEATEENYRHVGDVLVALRQANFDEGSCDACTEIGILDEMLKREARGARLRRGGRICRHRDEARRLTVRCGGYQRGYQ